ncbi:hypothetical protein EVAR_8220_1 [Eumeta japonica]|uniref:Uncharacterized protein n=1 Tax=Eumeta variegata TaxID=151549 RepID=A0A4C1TJ20_EUMVA|nr:hypothetical protein EVAR_8220_1 [Eumeta japonica]
MAYSSNAAETKEGSGSAIAAQYITRRQFRAAKFKRYAQAGRQNTIRSFGRRYLAISVRSRDGSLVANNYSPSGEWSTRKRALTSTNSGGRRRPVRTAASAVRLSCDGAGTFTDLTARIKIIDVFRDHFSKQVLFIHDGGVATTDEFRLHGSGAPIDNTAENPLVFHRYVFLLPASFTIVQRICALLRYIVKNIVKYFAKCEHASELSDAEWRTGGARCGGAALTRRPARALSAPPT